MNFVALRYQLQQAIALCALQELEEEGSLQSLEAPSDVLGEACTIKKGGNSKRETVVRMHR